MPPHVSGKFLTVDGRRFLVKGVSYGTFAPDANGEQFPAPARIAQDFALMAEAGINTVRTYTPPPMHLLDEAARCGLRVMAGLPWSQHIAFLDDRTRTREIRQEIARGVRAVGAHPATLMLAVGNEIPPAIVRWHGRARIERFLRDVYAEAKSGSPESLLTYVNYPPTEYLDTEAFDVCAFNVYLHRESELRAYLARLQQIAGVKPLLLAEAGADSIREGLGGQAGVTAMHIRAAFGEGLAGAVAFSWTDEWWRGGHTVDDWAFGLVDAARRPKPALWAVQDVFAEAPFAAGEREAWPKVSVVVCAYNAADTIDDCLRSLTALDYPDYEVLVVNDGSRDRTGDIAHGYERDARVRVIDIPNGGLSAARNVGLAEAAGAIVAYTDADVRVEPDWLSYLVQPFVTSDVAGSGGPNVVPADDPWVAQCVARAPGGPTHVLLSDRIAEHVPGCNMAFRRDALLAIGGFNPVYLRAGDDVDVCWRLQAKGQKIGFSPSALVWHHHRASVKAYWRQQVGYGEGETWLDAHHPEKFVRGNMIWKGRIYSPLPFVRSLSGRRINTGVWGTSAFPSVYRTDVNALQFLPHSPLWLVASSLFCVAAAVAFLVGFLGASVLLMSAGLVGWLTTLVRCARFAWRSDLSALGPLGFFGRARHRLLIAWMHFIQPLARFHGRVRGMLSPPLFIEPERVTRLPWKAQPPSSADATAATLLIGGGATEQCFWAETWSSHDALLTEVAGLLRASRPAHYVDVDDGWRADRDVSVALGRWGWVDLRALIEEHGGPKVLLRVGMRVRPALRGVLVALGFAAAAITMTSAAIGLRWPWLSAACVTVVGLSFARSMWQTTKAVALVRQAMQRAAAAAGMIPIPVRADSRRTHRLNPRPATFAQVAQTVVAAVLATSAVVTGTSLAHDMVTQVVSTARRSSATIARAQAAPTFDAAGALAVAPNGDVFFADARHGVIRRLDTRLYDRPVRASGVLPAPEPRSTTGSLQFQSPADVAVLNNGDMYVADAQNARICRIDRLTGRIITVAGSGGAGFDGDRKQATQAELNGPNAVAVARNGDLYIADTLNNRVRVVAAANGIIRTIAGDGAPGDGGPNGDGGPAIAAHLNHPTDVQLAPNGDLFIADMGHNRVRVVAAATGIIRTIAGNGTAGMTGDGGPAVEASLSGPSGLALVPSGRHLVIYVADYFNGSVRVITPDGLMATLGAPRQFVAPSRLAYRPGGWLYIANDHGDVKAVNVTKSPTELATLARQRKKVT